MPTNTELLNTPKNLLEGLEKQRRYLLQLAIVPLVCPSCGESVSKIDASGKSLDDYPVGNAPDDGYQCPHCHALLHYCVPLFGHEYWMTETAWKRAHGDAKERPNERT